MILNGCGMKHRSFLLMVAAGACRLHPISL
jgi:hypothetical protein